MRLMADVIELAINEYLRPGKYMTPGGTEAHFSCEAIRKATNDDDEYANDQIWRFLESMGMSLTIGRTQQFSEIAWGEKRQYARALWLTWAAMIAREEGKTL